MSEYITIQLTRGYETLVSECDGDLRNYRWQPQINKHHVCACKSEKRIDGKRPITYMHRVILARILERELVKGEQVDHINGNALDNRRENLRLAIGSQNNYNSRRYKNNTTGYKGVYFIKARRRWAAHIQVEGKNIYLGYFKTPEDAYVAYCEAAKKYFGEFARLE